jgi:uncharacterized SAM-binding protein YcdF (DUF218 family)
VFWLKKAVSFWLMPLPLSLALLLGGLALGALTRRRRGRGAVTLGVGLLLLCSTNVVSIRLLRPLERAYPPIPELAGPPAPGTPLAACRYVVVLGSGHSPMAGVSALGQLSGSGLGRLTEAVRLLRLLPQAQLIVSGPAEEGQRSHAEVLAAAAASLGIERDRIRLIDTARDTEDESAVVAGIVGDRPVALVTSAWHLPRAGLLFHHAHVAFVACPADFAARTDDQFRWRDIRLDSESLSRSTLAVHEWLGLLWLRLRGVSSRGSPPRPGPAGPAASG